MSVDVRAQIGLEEEDSEQEQHEDVDDEQEGEGEVQGVPSSLRAPELAVVGAVVDVERAGEGGYEDARRNQRKGAVRKEDTWPTVGADEVVGTTPHGRYGIARNIVDQSPAVDRQVFRGHCPCHCGSIPSHDQSPTRGGENGIWTFVFEEIVGSYSSSRLWNL